MAVKTPIEALRSVCARKKIGWPNGYGEAVLGFTYFGEDNEFYGIYQVRPRENGDIIVKMQFYRPPVQCTEAQGIQRDKFKNALLAWQALSDSEKKVWRDSASRRSRRGYAVFRSNYLNTH